MSRQRRMEKYARQQAQAAQQSAAAQQQESAAKASYYRMQQSIAAQEAAQRQADAQPRTCPHCGLANAPGAPGCNRCGAALTPNRPVMAPAPTLRKSGPRRAWAGYRGLPGLAQAGIAVGALIVLIAVAAAGGGGSKKSTTPSTVALARSGTPTAPPTTQAAAPAAATVVLHPGVCAAAKAPNAATGPGIQLLATDVPLAHDSVLTGLFATAQGNAAAGHTVRLAYDLGKIQAEACGTAAPATAPVPASVAPTTAPPVTAPPTTAPPAPTTTVSSQLANAVQAAQNYLSLGSGFSNAGLIAQLSSSAGDGYPLAIATEAVNSLNIDYNAQAVLAAKSYQQTAPLSCTDMVQQLDSAAGSQFTPAQAQYAAHVIGLC